MALLPLPPPALHFLYLNPKAFLRGSSDLTSLSYLSWLSVDNEGSRALGLGPLVISGKLICSD